MLKKYFPSGVLWDNKYIANKNLYKLITAFENYFLSVKTYLFKKYKIFNEENLSYWNIYVRIPDEVFKLDFRTQLFDKMLIKLNRKVNTLNGFLSFCQKLNIQVEILQNEDNLIHCKVRAIKYQNLDGASLLESDLVLNLTGATADYNFFIKEMVRNYLEKTTIATSQVIVDIWE
jgi:hypothetical protein